MRVALINPPCFYQFEPSLGLCYIAAVLEKAGHEVAIVDKPINTVVGDLSPATISEAFDANFKKVIEEVLRTKPELIGTTATSHTFYALKLLGILKELLPEAKTVAGGPHVTFTADDVLSKYGSVDFVVRHEGEYIMLELTKALEQDHSLEGIRGLSYRRNDKIVNNPNAPVIEDLDALPYPARHLINLEDYPQETRITLASARGCPHPCIFCEMHQMWRGYRPRSVENVLGELTHLVQKYSPKRISFVDSTFVVDRDRTVRLCRGIRERGLDFIWSVLTRVDHHDRESLKEMHKAGCRILYLGVESGEDSTLSTINKEITTRQIENTVKMMLEIGFEVICSFVINWPFETMERAEATIQFAKKLQRAGAKIQGHMLIAYPGTEIYDNMEKYNLTPKYRGEELWKILGQQYLPGESIPLLSNNVISEQQLSKLWSEITSGFDYWT
jgi:radical SAM superfamily enzyme YgiQ (UPF0313 family)